MIRNYHDTIQINFSRQELNIDEMQKSVKQMLTKINEIDEKLITRYKFRQFFFTFDVVSNQNDDIIHFLNIEIVRQLKY